MDSFNLLESKITHFTSYDDISFYLGSNVSNCPQKISNNFVKNFGVLIDQAIRDESLQNVGVIVQVFNHLLQQNQPDTIQVLISCGFHEQFGVMLGFAFSQVSLKKLPKPAGDQLYLTLLRLIVDYCRNMNDHFNWFFQNLLQKITFIISDCTVYYVIRMQTAEKFLEIFSDEDREAVEFLRDSIGQNVEVYGQICEKAFKSLPHVGDFQLQESIVELIFRMWPSNVRKSKVMKWCEGNQQLLTKFLAISYDKFDYGVRIFLNDVNSSSAKRKVLTLNYMELQIGEQTLVPCNQWNNCVDFCYESKDLSMRFPVEESSEQHKGSWITGSIEAADLVSFRTSENPVMRSIDLHIEFESFTSQVLKEFELMDELATNLVIRFYRVAPLDASHLLKFTSSLFGSKYASMKQKRKGFVSRPQTMLIMNQDHSQHSDHNTSRNNTSFINMPEANGSLPSSQKMSRTASVKNSQKLSQSVARGEIHRPTQDIVPSSQPRRQTSISDNTQQASQQRKLSNSSRQMLAQGSQRCHGASKPSSACIMNKVPIISLRDLCETPVTSRKPHQGSISSQVMRENKMMNYLAMHAVTSGRKSTDTFGISHDNTSQTTRSGGASRQEAMSHVASQRMGLSKSISNSNQTMSRASLQKSDPAISRSKSSVASQRVGSVSEASSHAMSQKVESARSVTYSASSMIRNLPKSNKSTVKKSESKHDPAAGSYGGNSSDEFKNSSKNKKQRPICEIVKEAGNTSVEWKDIVPETQAVLNNSTLNPLDVDANISTDLMLSCLHGEEPRKSPPKPAKSSEKSKTKTTSSKMVYVDIHRKVMKNSSKTSQKLNDSISPEFPSQVLSAVITNQSQNANLKKKNASSDIATIPEDTSDEQNKIDSHKNIEKSSLPDVNVQNSSSVNKGKKSQAASKVNTEFKHLQKEFSDKENIRFDSLLKEKKANEKKAWENVVGKQNKRKSGRLLSAKKKKRSLINTEISEPLEDLSLNDPMLPDLNDDVLKSVKKMPYAAKFIKTPIDNEKKVNRGKRTRTRDNNIPTVVEIYKTESELETGETTTTEQSGRDQKSGDSTEQTDSTSRYALKRLNVDPRPGGLEKARQENESEKLLKQEIQLDRHTRAKKQKELELPFAEIEEIPVIEESLDEIQPIETVRDAPTCMDEDPVLIPLPNQLEIRKRRKSEGGRLLETSYPSEPEVLKKKRPKVSFDEFDFNLKDEENDFISVKKKGKDKKSKRKKKARLFDSFSDAASAASSDMSWVKEHIKKIQNKESPKPIKTYLMKNKNNTSPLNLPALDSLTNYNMQDISTSSSNQSASSPEVVRPEVTNTSLMSGIAKMQSFAKACNLTFEDIVGNKMNDPPPLSKPDEVSPLDLEEFNFDPLPDFGTLTKATKEKAKKHDMDTESNIEEPQISPLKLNALINEGPGDIGETFMSREYENEVGENFVNQESPDENYVSKDEFSDELSEIYLDRMKSHRRRRDNENDDGETPWHKKGNTLKPFKVHELARLNNNTPSESSVGMTIRENNKKKPTKRKIEPRSSPVNAFDASNYKSKKKLNMRLEQASSRQTDSSNLSLNASGRSDWLSKRMIRKMGKYIRDVNNTWNMGDSVRNEGLEVFKTEVSECEQKHNMLMKEMKELQSRQFSFIQKFNGKVEKVMDKAAKNIMEVKSRHSDFLRKLHQTTEIQKDAMEELRSKISKELREIILQSKV
uniref:uncharacterized protein LOC120347438 isoform X2 n=1 Tax=Styela clava TaxID=7725 RepID=UPI00193958AA|nr:uncharacterized protein LOC120347438 isoform X2 [Styela clava]